MDGDVLDDAAGRGDGETRRGLCCVGSFMSRCVGGGRGVAPAARAGRRRRAPWCSCVAVVMRGTGGRRAGGGRVGANNVASDVVSTQFERCTAPFRALLGPLVVPLLHGVVEEPSRGRRLAQRLVPLERMAIYFFGPEHGRAGPFFKISGHQDVQKERHGPRSELQKDRYSDGLGVGIAALVDAVGGARNVVAAAFSRVAECAFLPSKYVVDFGRELAPLKAVV